MKLSEPEIFEAAKALMPTIAVEYEYRSPDVDRIHYIGKAIDDVQGHLHAPRHKLDEALKTLGAYAWDALVEQEYDAEYMVEGMLPGAAHAAHDGWKPRGTALVFMLQDALVDVCVERLSNEDPMSITWIACQSLVWRVLLQEEGA